MAKFNYIAGITVLWLSIVNPIFHSPGHTESTIFEVLLLFGGHTIPEYHPTLEHFIVNPPMSVHFKKFPIADVMGLCCWQKKTEHLYRKYN